MLYHITGTEFAVCSTNVQSTRIINMTGEITTSVTYKSNADTVPNATRVFQRHFSSGRIITGSWLPLSFSDNTIGRLIILEDSLSPEHKI